MYIFKLILLLIAGLCVYAGSAAYLFSFTSEEDENEAEAQRYKNWSRGYNCTGLLIAFIAGAL